MRTVVQGCAVATVDERGTEYADGHVVVEGNRIVVQSLRSTPSETE